MSIVLKMNNIGKFNIKYKFLICKITYRIINYVYLTDLIKKI